MKNKNKEFLELEANEKWIEYVQHKIRKDESLKSLDLSMFRCKMSDSAGMDTKLFIV